MKTEADILDCDLTLRAIRHACIAGGCESWARRDRLSAAGLRKVAAKHRRDAAALLAELVRR